MPLRTYLARHFVKKSVFARLAGVSIERLNDLIEKQAIPDATYKCDGRTFTSAVFGSTPTTLAQEGEYFRPECVRWVKIANLAKQGSERGVVRDTLVSELRIALEDCEDKGRSLGREEAENKIEQWLPSFWDGTFGLCVADPSNGAGIARKEILQERLTRLTENGSNQNPEGVTQKELLDLIDEYAKSTMPFSPIEYARSSRKRLVDDLRQLVEHAGLTASKTTEP